MKKRSSFLLFFHCMIFNAFFFIVLTTKTTQLNSSEIEQIKVNKTNNSTVASGFKPLLSHQVRKNKKVREKKTKLPTKDLEHLSDFSDDNFTDDNLNEDYDDDHCESRKDVSSFDSFPRPSKSNGYLKQFLTNRPKSNKWRPSFYHRQKKPLSELRNNGNNVFKSQHNYSLSNAHKTRQMQRQIIEFPIAIPIEPIPMIAKVMESLPPAYNQMSSISFPVFVPEKTLDQTYNYVKQRYIDPPILVSLHDSKMLGSLRDGPVSMNTLPMAPWTTDDSFMNSAMLSQLTSSNFNSPLSSFGSQTLLSPGLGGLDHLSGISDIASSVPYAEIPSYGNKYSPDSSLSSDLPSEALFGGFNTNSLYSGLLETNLPPVQNPLPMYAYPVFTSPNSKPESNSNYIANKQKPSTFSFSQILPQLIQQSTGYRNSLTKNDVNTIWPLLYSSSNPTASFQTPNVNKSSFELHKASTSSNFLSSSSGSTQNDSNEFVLQVRPLNPKEPIPSDSTTVLPTALKNINSFVASSLNFPVRHKLELENQKSKPRSRFSYKTLLQLATPSKFKEFAKSSFPLPIKWSSPTSPISSTVTNNPYFTDSWFEPLGNKEYSQSLSSYWPKPKIPIQDTLSSSTKLTNQTQTTDDNQSKSEELIQTESQSKIQKWIPSVMLVNSTNRQH